MENKSTKEQLSPNQSVSVVATPSYSISEITAKYKILNKNLVEAMDIIDLIYDTEIVDEDDFNTLNSLDLHFQRYQIQEIELNLHGDSIFRNIIESLFEESMLKANNFFDGYDPNYWEIKSDETINIIIKNGVKVTAILAFWKLLYYSLTQICYLGEFHFLDDREPLNINFDLIHESYDFSETVKHANQIVDLNDRIDFYQNEIARKELICLQLDKNEVIFRLSTDFINKCTKAIEITTNQLAKKKKLKTHDSETSIEPKDNVPNQNELIPVSSKMEIAELEPEEINIKNSQFTTSRQVLAIYYLLNEIDRKGINQIDKTIKARFIEFLTGKNYNNIYKVISNPFKGLDSKNPKSIKNDMEYIANHFGKLGIQSIVNQINNDIKQD